MGDRDFEEVNRLAMEQISALEKGERPKETIPQLSRGGFWNDDYTSRYRPSSNKSTAAPSLFRSTPRSYYTSKDYNVNSAEGYHKRVLNAIYRHESSTEEEEGQENKDNKELEMIKVIPEKAIDTSFGSLLFAPKEVEESRGLCYTPTKHHVKFKVPQEAKNQMTAIVLSGVARMFSTMVYNFAKRKEVPYELL